MIQSCVTVSLVPEARGGPFVFRNDFGLACRGAAKLGFDAVELFPPTAQAITVSQIKHDLTGHQLQLAAVGTGAGRVKHGLSLTAGGADARRQAVEFVRSIIELAGQFGAATIIGSMQGRTCDGLDKHEALKLLSESLGELGDYAAKRGSLLLLEPLNRYETDLINTLAEGIQLREQSGSVHLKLLADLFHLNIEEVEIAAAVRGAGTHLGHVHWVDSNRRAAGMGHLDFAPVAAALTDINYAGFISAEALPLPDSDSAASATIRSFQEYFA